MPVVKEEHPSAEWDRLVRECPWGSFYHSRVNVDLLREVSPAKLFFLTVSEKGRLVGGIACAMQDGPLGPVANCLPYFGSYGDALWTTDAPPGTGRLLYEALLDECRGADALCLNVITSPFADPAQQDVVKEFLHPTFIDERRCQFTVIPEYRGEGREVYGERVMAAMEGRARTAYRKIVKSGFSMKRVETEAEAMEFAAIHEANLGGKGGIFKTKEFFRKALAMSQAHPDQASLIVLTDQGKITAGVVLFYTGEIVEYHTTCLRDEYRSIGPMNRIVIDKMIEAGMAGYRIWNFGGTWKSQDGVYKFKQSFGAVERRYVYYTTFFRDVGKVKAMTAGAVMKAYPLCYVIPFSELPPERP